MSRWLTLFRLVEAVARSHACPAPRSCAGTAVAAGCGGAAAAGESQASRRRLRPSLVHLRELKGAGEKYERCMKWDMPQACLIFSALRSELLVVHGFFGTYGGLPVPKPGLAEELRTPCKSSAHAVPEAEPASQEEVSRLGMEGTGRGWLGVPGGRLI